MGKNPTIYDVSRKAGVSSATVSRVLNNPGKVNADTRAAVENAIKELGYKPLLEVRLRSVKEVPRICICAPHFTAPSYVQRLRGISNALNSLPDDYDLQVYSVNSKAQLDRFVETIEMRGIDGVIFLSLKMDDSHIQKLNDAGIPSVLVEEDSRLTSTITNDNLEGGRIAARHLIERGYSDFGVLCEPYEWDYCVHTLQPRLDGFVDELKKNGYELKKENIITEHLSLENVRDVFRGLFKKGKYPRAIFTTADIMAFGIVQAARDYGLEIPGDIAVIGFDDIDFADVLGLTTISQHLDESGEIAARIIASQIRDSRYAVQNVNLGLNLIEREST